MDNSVKIKRAPVSEDGRIIGDNLLGDSAVLESLNGDTVGMKRDVYYLGNVKTPDEKTGNLTELIIVGSPGKYVEYVADPGGSLKFDDEEGIATFSSRGFQYKIRAIQPSEMADVDQDAER